MLLQPRRAAWVVVLSVLLLGSAIPAQAGAVMRLNCTGTTVCDDVTIPGGGTTLQLTGNTLPTFDVTHVGNLGLGPGEMATAFLVIAVPNDQPLLSFTVNGSTPSFEGNWNTPSKILSEFLMLNVASGAGVDAELNPFLTAANGILPSPVDGFNLYVVSLGAFGEGDSISVNFGGIAGFPSGTFFWSYLETSYGEVIATTPISNTVMIPEPGTMTLLSFGLLGVCGLLRRRRAF